MSDYERGFTDALELDVSELEETRDLEVRLLLGLALEHKVTELKHKLGYVILTTSSLRAARPKHEH